MTDASRYSFALVPGVLTVGCWMLAQAVLPTAECKGHVKGLHGCQLFGVDVTALLGFGLFWAPLLAFVAVPLSLWFVFSIWSAKRYGPPRQRG